MGSSMDFERPWEREEREENERKRALAPRLFRDRICNLGAVEVFREAMLAKLSKNADKQSKHPFWHEPGCTQADLSAALRHHVEKGDPVDVANFCMMLHARGEGILSALTPAPAPDQKEMRA